MICCSYNLQRFQQEENTTVPIWEYGNAQSLSCLLPHLKGCWQLDMGTVPFSNTDVVQGQVDKQDCGPLGLPGGPEGGPSMCDQDLGAGG